MTNTESEDTLKELEKYIGDACHGECHKECALLKRLSQYNKELYTDVLTGAYNRRYYEEQVKNSDMVAGVAMIDVDDFKYYNDRFGHEAGDLALATVAQTIIKNIRHTDILIRMGGDEFLLVMPGISKEIFFNKLRYIQGKIYDARVDGYSKLKLSVSIGGVNSGEDGVIEDVLRLADRYMYRAKANKNMVITEYNQDICCKHNDRKDSAVPVHKVLIIDGNSEIRDAFSGVIRNGYDIIEANDKEECASAIQGNEGDISLILVGDNISDGDVVDYVKNICGQEGIPLIRMKSL